MSLERKAISALKWATASKVIVQLMSWAGTLIVVRLLVPADYGLMAKVSVVCTIAATIAELGLGTSVARSASLSTNELQGLSLLTLLFGLAMTLLLAACSPLFAWALREPRVTWPIAVASLQILIGAFAVVPRALATRELAFKFLAHVELVAGLCSIAVTLVMAWLGAGVWALVGGALLGALVRAIGSQLYADWHWPGMPERGSLRGIDEHIRFGLTLVGNRVTYYVVVQSDVLLGSLFLSTTDIGFYSVALQLATLPMSKVMGIINEITLPTVAQQQHERARVKAATLKAIGLVALTAMPVLLGISAVAPELVHLLFDRKWDGAIVPLIILPLIVPLRMICSILFTTSLALGNRQLDLRNTVANFALIPTGFFIGAHWGLMGLSLSWLVAVPLTYAVSVPAVLRALDITWQEFARQVRAPLCAAAVMYAAVYVFRHVTSHINEHAQLAALIGAGAGAYALAAIALAKSQVQIARSFVRSLAGRRGS
jgi:O-antigen/teichoic acid export membrane protein